MEIPQVKPRDMHALVAGVVETHTAIRDSIIDAATARETYYAQKDKELNAQARLEGKTTT
jgi:hypothetical protein